MHDLVAAAILEEQREQNRLLRDVARSSRGSEKLLYDILQHLKKNVTAASIAPQGDQTMQTRTFLVTYLPADAEFDPAKAAVSSSDPVNAPVALAEDGVTISLTPPDGAVPGTYTVTWSYANADGVEVTAIDNDVVIAAPVIDVASASIAEV